MFNLTELDVRKMQDQSTARHADRFGWMRIEAERAWLHRRVARLERNRSARPDAQGIAAYGQLLLRQLSPR